LASAGGGCEQSSGYPFPKSWLAIEKAVPWPIPGNILANVRGRLFTFAAALSLLLCLATTMLWVRSYRMKIKIERPTHDDDRARYAINWILNADGLLMVGGRARDNFAGRAGGDEGPHLHAVFRLDRRPTSTQRMGSCGIVSARRSRKTRCRRNDHPQLRGAPLDARGPQPDPALHRPRTFHARRQIVYSCVSQLF
jgi:hypothetical protein